MKKRTKSSITTAEFVQVWYNCQRSPKLVAQHFGIHERRVFEKRDEIFAQDKVYLESKKGGVRLKKPPKELVQRYELDIDEGVIIVFSDASLFSKRNTQSPQSFDSIN